jgi:hypothetical protein
MSPAPTSRAAPLPRIPLAEHLTLAQAHLLQRSCQRIKQLSAAMLMQVEHNPLTRVIMT